MRRRIALISVVAGMAATCRAAEGWQPVGMCGGGAMFSLAASCHDANVVMLSCDMGGAYISRDGGRTWRMVHHAMLRGCTVCAPAFHPAVPGRIYAASGWSGDLRVSADNGRTWKPYGRGRPWRQRPTLLYADAGQPRRIFVGTFAGLYKTEDDGANWARCTGVTGKVLGLSADRRGRGAGRTYVAGTTEGVYRSDDGGGGFRCVAVGLPDRRLIAFSGGSSDSLWRLYAAVPCTVVAGKLSGGVHASSDGGATWRSCMAGGLNVQTRRSSKWANGDVPEYRFIATTDADPRRAYVYCTGTSYYPPNHSTIYRTDDGGADWRAVLFSDPRFKQYNAEDDYLTLAVGQRWQDPPYSMAVNSAQPDVVMTSSSMFVSRTDDGGKRWRVCHAVAAPHRRDRYTAWVNNGLVVTTTWNYYADPHDKRRHYICYTDIGLARSLDAGRTWIWEGPRLPWRNTVYELAFDPAAAGRIWGAFSNTHDIPNANVIKGRHKVRMSGGVAVSDDHGRTWKPAKLPEAPALSIVLDAASPPEGRTLYASLFERGVYRSTDGGKTWRHASRGLGHPQNMRCCRLCLHRDGTLFVLVTAKRTDAGTYTSNGVGLYRSADRGETWSKINESQPLHWVKDFSVHPADSRTILLSAADVPGHAEGGLYRTTDAGKAWKRIARKGPEHFGAFYHPDRPGWIYMTLTEDVPGPGLWLSRDDGATWEPFLRLPFPCIHRVHFLPDEADHIVVTTFGGSVFRGPIAPAGPPPE